MYGCESWIIKKAECRTIDVYELKTHFGLGPLAPLQRLWGNPPHSWVYDGPKGVPKRRRPCFYLAHGSLACPRVCKWKKSSWVLSLILLAMCPPHRWAEEANEKIRRKKETFWGGV